MPCSSCAIENLHVMPGVTLVISDDLELILRHRRHVGEVRVVDAWARAVGHACEVMLRRARLRSERLDAFHLEVGFRPATAAAPSITPDSLRMRPS